MGALSLFLGLLATIIMNAARISTTSGFPIHQYALPAVELVPGPITVDRKNDVWFAQQAVTRIGELRADGTLHVYQVAGIDEQILALAAADDGKVWFTQTLTYDGSRNRVGYIGQDVRVASFCLLPYRFASRLPDKRTAMLIASICTHSVDEKSFPQSASCTP